VLPQLIKAYAHKHPGNTLRLHDASSHDVRAAVLDGQAELGIAINGEPHAELEEIAGRGMPKSEEEVVAAVES